MNVLEFSVSPNSSKGDVYATTFTFTKISFPSYTNLTWDFGDGNVAYNKDSVSHVYNYPGVYTISLSAWSPSGEIVTAFNFVDVDYVYRDAIEITNIPSNWTVPGAWPSEPFYVSLTSAKIDQPISIVLHAVGSKSLPYDVTTSKWDFLNPKWRFINAETNEIVTGPITLDTEPIYKNGSIVAVSGVGAFYYIDDNPTITEVPSCPTIVLATLSAQNFSYPPESLIYPYYSYSNNEMVQAAIVWQTKQVVPTDLSITENYLNNIYFYKWTGIPIPVMINCRFNPDKLTTYQYVSGINSADVFDYPKTNAIGLLNQIDIKLAGYNSSEYKVNNSPLFFQKTDKNGLPIGGYLFTTITPLVSTKGVDRTTYVIASSVATNQAEEANKFPFPIAYPLDTIAYVAHPYANNINKIYLASYDDSCDYYKQYKDKIIVIDGKIKCIDVPELKTANTNNLEVSGVSNIYGLSYNPFTKVLYGADVDQNTILAVDQNDQILSITPISAATNKIYNTPSYISIDGQNNVWVSLYDSATLLKYDSTLQTVLASATPVLSAYDIVDEEGSPMIEPSVVETDRDNNLWACYSHPLSSLLVKYSSSGVHLTGCNLGYYSTPSSLAIDKNNRVWVSCFDGNKVQCYSTQGALLSSFEFLKPSYIAVDKENNIWLTHGYNLYSFLNTQTRTVSSWEINTVTKRTKLFSSQHLSLSAYPTHLVEELKSTNEIWGGLAVDVFDRVWLIDSENNNIINFLSKTPTFPKIFAAAPKATKNFIVETNKSYSRSVNTSVVRSIQANGDWTGNRWYQKYATSYLTNTIAGSSDLFQVNNLDSLFTVAKVNDDFNCASYIKSLAFPEILNQNTEFFNEFLPSLVGDGNFTKQDLGRRVYERIANFVTNHSDIDTAEIPQLLSLAEQLSVPANRYGVDFPADVLYYLSLFSIPRQHLMGIEKLNPDFTSNIGPILTLSDLISAGQYLYVRDRRYGTYQLVFTTRTSAQELIYPLSSIQVNGLRTPVHDQYYFFEYEPKILGYHSNVVDWSSPNTTLSRTLSSNSVWFDDEQILDVYFNNLLTKHLFTT